MGPTSLQQSIDASIEVSNLQLSYKPGDTITGVIKKVHIKNLSETVTANIKIVGRIETVITEETNNSDGHKSTWHHTGEVTLFSVNQQVYHGSVPHGINSWPFSISIPPENSTYFDGWHQRTTQALPPSHLSSNQSVGETRDYVVVEYLLQAEIVNVLVPGKPGIATFPLHVQLPTTQQPITNPGIQAQFSRQQVRTLHLDPENADKHLSFRQHMQTIFKPSSIPSYSYSIVVEYPSVIQLDHPSPLPLRIRAVPDLDPSRAKGIPVEKPPSLTLLSAELRLRASVHVNDLEGTSHYVTGKTESSWEDTPLFRWSQGQDPSSIIIPDGTAGCTDALDIGERLGLHVSSRDASVSGFLPAPSTKPIHPSFLTHHISQHHQIKWKLAIGCAGKTRKVTGKAPITVLGPSEGQDRVKSMGLTEEGVREAYRDWHRGGIGAPSLAFGAARPSWPTNGSGGTMETDPVTQPLKPKT